LAFKLPFQAPPVQISPHHSFARKDHPDSFLELWPNNYLSGKIKVSAYTLEKQYKITNSALTIHHQRRKPEFAVGDSATHRMHHQHFP